MYLQLKMSFLEMLTDSFIAIFGRGGIHHTGGGSPVKRYNKGPLYIDIVIANDVVDSQIECSVCLSLYQLEDPASMLICGHYFHNECYREWKRTCADNNRVISCPICRG